MNRRTFLKTLAFTVGLYFVLNFLLPEKLGGDFDSYNVHSPTAVQTPDGTVVLYVGQYSSKLAAVGRLQPAPLGNTGMTRMPDHPVLRRSLFIPDDQHGMAQLDAVVSAGSIELFYMGIDRENRLTLCRATGNMAGTEWSKQSPPHFRTSMEHPPATQPGVYRNGLLGGTLEFFAVDKADDTWRFVLLIKSPIRGREIWLATATDLQDLRLAPQPLVTAHDIPLNFTAFDAHSGQDGWTLFFASERDLISLPVAAPADASRRTLLPDGQRATGLRLEPDAGMLYLSTSAYRPSGTPPEESAVETRLAALEISDQGQPDTLHTTGKPPVPTYLGRGMQMAGTFLQIIGAMALFIAVINLSLFHGKTLTSRRKGWPNSLVFFIFLIGMFVVTLMGKGMAGGEALDSGWGLAYDFLFQSIVQAMGTAVFSMITFFMISAAYRSFRVRSLDAALLMAAACIVMVGQMPLGEWLGMIVPDSLFFLRFPWLSQKLLTVINACAYRGVLIGLTVGAISIAIRIWLGMDNSVYSGLEGKS